MRRLDETPIDPEVASALDAIDATLAGDPVDPRHAELAELALLLAAQRPSVGGGFGASLDERVARRFAGAPPAAPARAAGAAPARRRAWWLAPGAGLALAGVAALAVVLSSGGAGTPGLSGSSGGPVRAVSGAAASGAAVTTATAPPTAKATPPPPVTAQTSAGATFGAQSGAVASASPAAPLPPANGRKIIQSAQLALITAPGQIDAVAQEVFDAVGAAGGIVSSSTVTATGNPAGYAQFQLSVPSGALPQAMASLSTLRFAHVISRTDATQDVNGQYIGDVRALADARALRTALLKQLANAGTQAQIDSLTAQIHDAEASISSDEAALRGLEARVNYSTISLTINAGQVPVPVVKGGGFGIGKAAHDAGRVLTVAAGVALVAAAALVPLGLLGALVWWGGAAVRRRRREQALDLA